MVVAAPKMITVKATHPSTPAVAALIAQLDDYQLSLYPRQFCYLDSPAQLVGEDAYFVAAYKGDDILGCGAIKYARGDCAYGEIKRMFVKTEARGSGVSEEIMANLEADARAKKVAAIRLETGIHQPEAIGLYARFGYKRRGPFGDYPDDPLSVFMEKNLRETRLADGMTL